jgi:hypothetical protein
MWMKKSGCKDTLSQCGKEDGDGFEVASEAFKDFVRSDYIA